MPGIIHHQTAAAIRRRLQAWYAKHQRPLPWRATADPYAIWVSEVMLQQTQVAAAGPYYRRFLSAFPDIPALAGADIQAVLKHWEGLGYYARARNLHRAAQILVKTNRGRVPDSFDAFIQLPGVGDYIASAVMSIAFGHAHAVVDGNVKRVLARLFTLDEPANSSRAHAVYKPIAERMLDRERPAAFNQALMELGALICRPRNPRCPQCPLSGLCRACRGDNVDTYPRKEKRKKIPEFRQVAGVIVKKGKVLIVRRPPEGLLGGLWEFPTGERHTGETAEEAMVRVARTVVGLHVSPKRLIARVRHAYSHFRVVVDVLGCRFTSGRVRRRGPVAHRWTTLKALERYPMHRAHLKFLPALTDALEAASAREDII